MNKFFSSILGVFVVAQAVFCVPENGSAKAFFSRDYLKAFVDKAQNTLYKGYDTIQDSVSSYYYGSPQNKEEGNAVKNDHDVYMEEMRKVDPIKVGKLDNLLDRLDKAAKQMKKNSQAMKEYIICSKEASIGTDPYVFEESSSPFSDSLKEWEMVDNARVIDERMKIENMESITGQLDDSVEKVEKWLALAQNEKDDESSIRQRAAVLAERAETFAEQTNKSVKSMYNPYHIL